ncbi:GtrA family protein [Paenibacillus sp. IHBB 10380]|uniref:GtrA family protein n=1 Tax=Paenibacillus sp. IHBB 10380 TaxID=1566358 RepID=UPI0005CF9F7B|nr:GtrA family protein [Paenibacillus sp. IHBB 10380]AJS60348.1 membrane protein [Paenibacillus sp. IHBB 10380]
MTIRSLLRLPLIKYAIVGGLGTGIHFAVLIMLVELWNMNPVVSSIIGFIVVLIISYFLNRIWTFENQQSGYAKQFMKYVIVSCAGMFINTLIMYVTVEWLSISYIVGQLISTVVVPIHNYIWNRRWTFTPETTSMRTRSGEEKL